MCRLCGTSDLQHASKSKTSFRAELQELFKINTELDDPHIHPSALCRTHEKLLERFVKAKEENKSFQTAVIPAMFISHSDICNVCNPAKKRKHKAKGTKKSSLKKYFPETSSRNMKQQSVTPINVTDETQIMETEDENQIEVEMHHESSNETTSNSENATPGEVIQMFKKLSSKDRKAFHELLIGTLSVNEQSELAYLLGTKHKRNIYHDAELVSVQYLSKETLLNMDPKQWLLERNRVLCSFLKGITGADDSNPLANQALPFCRTVEQVYNLRCQKLVAPFSFLLSLDNYTKTSSRLAVDALSKAGPSGSYNTLQKWLFESGQVAPRCPENVVMAGFDNEQIIGYKRGVGAGNKSLSSVITTEIFVKMQDSGNANIQSNQSLKPKNWFNVNSFDEKQRHLEKNHAEQEQLQQLMNDKTIFIEEVRKIRDSSLEEYGYLEQIHYQQLYFFLTRAIKDVVQEQEITDSGLVDYIDRNADRNNRSKNILVCSICGAENARRKLKCDNCNQREGIKEARKMKCSNEKEFRKQAVSTEVLSKSTEQNEPEQQRYQHVATSFKKKTDVVMGMPAFMNPNSNETVALVLRHIGLNCEITKYGGTKRHWAFVCCDGRPHSLYQKLLDQCVVCSYCNKPFLTREAYRMHHKEDHSEELPSCQREFDWVYMRIGMGHFEMNVIKAFFELNWTPYLETVCEQLNFTSDNAKAFAKTCKDHHVSWQLLLTFHTSTMKEMVLPYVRIAMSRNETPTPEKFIRFYKDEMSDNPKWVYLHLQVFRFSQAIINLRMGIRRNNSDLVKSAKFHLKELFYGRSHLHYQNIEMHDTLQYHFMPDVVRNVWDDNTSFTVSGHPSKGQDLDFLLEEKNRAVKQFIPSGTVHLMKPGNLSAAILKILKACKKKCYLYLARPSQRNSVPRN